MVGFQCADLEDEGSVEDEQVEGYIGGQRGVKRLSLSAQLLLCAYAQPTLSSTGFSHHAGCTWE